jgi:hypothetical protein
LQRALDSLIEWTEKWGMTFNISKCKVMHLGNGNLGTQLHDGRPSTGNNRTGEGHRSDNL